MTRPLRSVLFLPASNPRAVAKARTLDCDAVILDLEDAVGPEDKAAARAAVAAALAEGFGGRLAGVRVNGPRSPWGREDLAAMARAAPQVLVLPKVRGPGDLSGPAAAVPGAALWAMVETCDAVLALPRIAAAEGLGALVLGQNDLAAEMGCRPGGDRAPLQAAMSLLVTSARAHGLAALDGVFNRLDDAEGFLAECRQGRAFGFDGKTLIHPSQVAPANAAFRPTAEELDWARAVVAAFEDPANAGRGAIRVGQEMAERLHLERARRLLRLGGVL